MSEEGGRETRRMSEGRERDREREEGLERESRG